MKNSLSRTLFHWFVCRAYKIKSFRGGWMLTHLFIDDYRQFSCKLFFKIATVHLKGWSYVDWSICDINNSNRHKFINTREYCKLHPLNGQYSSWIDDKLTLKYILHGTEAGQYLPSYYYEITQDGKILPLMDLSANLAIQMSVNGIIAFLEQKEVLAFKLTKASLGIGFYKAEFKNECYYLNGEAYSRDEFAKKLSTLKGYLITEFLSPHREFAKYCPKSVGCMRYLIARDQSGTIKPLYAFMRIGTKQSNFVENYAAGGVLTYINLANGHFSGGNVLDAKHFKNIKVENHPDTGIEIKGSIPHWDVVKKAAKQIADAMPQLSYMGIDFCLSDDDRVKVIEINSLSSLDAFTMAPVEISNRMHEYLSERLSVVTK